MESNSTTNHVKVFFYSIIISIMSWINRLRTRPEQMEIGTVQPYSGNGVSASTSIVGRSESIFKINWRNLSQVILSLTIWILMGFAAGFLIGMLTPR